MRNYINPNSVSVGAALPDWCLDRILDEDIPFRQDFLGKPLLILFFSLGCPGCVGRAIPYANRVVFENAEDINVLGIHTQFEGTEFSTQEFEGAKKEFHMRFPFFKDRNNNETYLDYGAGGTPHWVLVDKNGFVVYSIFGSDPNNALLRLDYKIAELINV
jgi:thiol-disulfide isomerase/thioredoxin